MTKATLITVVAVSVALAALGAGAILGTIEAI